MTNTLSKMLCGSEFYRYKNLHIRRVFGQCYYNAHYNRKYVPEMSHLKPVFGSMGLAGHFEYGGRNHTAADFYKNPLDSHCWLEDDKGNVYDYIHPQYVMMATMWGKKPIFTEQMVYGVSKATLAKIGLEYIPTTKRISNDILNNVKAQMKGTGIDWDMSVFD